MDARQCIGIIGSLLVALGSFTPLLLNQSAYSSGSLLGYLLILFSTNSALFCWAKNYTVVFLITLITLFCVVEEYIRISGKLHQATEQIEATINNSPFSGLSPLITQHIGMRWGWLFLACSLMIVFVAVFWDKLKRIISSSTAH